MSSSSSSKQLSLEHPLDKDYDICSDKQNPLGCVWIVAGEVDPPPVPAIVSVADSDTAASAVIPDSGSSISTAETIPQHETFQHRLETLLGGRPFAALQELRAGLSGTIALKVTFVDGLVCFAKLVLDWNQLSKLDECRAEFGNAEWASDKGLGPAVLAVDEVAGTLVTEYLDGEMYLWSDGNKEPRLGATLATMRRLHNSDAPRHPTQYDTGRALAKWTGRLESIKPKDRVNPALMMEVAKSVALKAMAVLSELTYPNAYCHGDLCQLNVIFSHGQAIFIDWGALKLGDPMEDLAYYAYHINVGLGGLQPLIDGYGGVSTDEGIRLRAHLVLNQALRYLGVIRPEPYHLPEWRDFNLKVHERWLLEGEEWLRTL